MACGQWRLTCDVRRVSVLHLTNIAVRAIRNGNFKIKEELPERNYDLWGGGGC